MGNKNTKVIEINRKCLDSGSDCVVPKHDLHLLKTIGFEIQELIGWGEVGSVYRGVYGYTASGIRDRDGQLLNVRYGQHFALKYIDIKRREELELRNGRIERMETIRRFVEKEKQMRQKLVNSDLLQINICVDFGEYQAICVNSEEHKPISLEDIDIRPSFDRLYLFMDFSKLGNLDKYLLHLSSKSLSVSHTEASIWCQRLLSALKYLHESNVYYVNIKPQNILMFTEYIRSEGETYVVPKLTDFWINDYFGDQNNSLNDSSSEEETSYSEVKYSDKELSQMTDIYVLADIFHAIISKTQFKSKCIRVLALDLIESMRDFSHKRCDHFLQNQWFESKVVDER